MLSAGWMFGASTAGIWFVVLSGLRELAIGFGSTVSTVVASLILAECGLFATLFWSLDVSGWGHGHNERSEVLPSAQGLVLAMTTVLSGLSIAMGRGFIIGLGLKWLNGYPSTVLTTVLTGVFCLMFIGEYRAVSLYANDSAMISSIFMLTAVHFGHVFTALVLAWALDRTWLVRYRPALQNGVPGNHVVNRAGWIDTGLLLYVHFVEAAWIGIHGTAYI